MYSFLKIKSLTTVALVLGTLWVAPMAWGQAKQIDDCKVLEEAYDRARANLPKEKNVSIITAGEKNVSIVTADDSKKQEAVVMAERRYTECRKEKETYCSNLYDQYSDLIKKYEYDTRVKADECLALDDESDSSLTVAIMQAVVGVHENPLDGRPECKFGTKDDFDDQIKEKVKQIDEYEKSIREAEEDIVKSEKKLTEEVNKLQEERQKLKEQWEEAQQDSQDAMEKALSQMRDNQIKIQNQIRKIQTELLTARQNLNKVQSDLKAELAKQGLQSESSIDRICQAQARDYYDKRYAPSKGKKSSSISRAASKGKRKTSDVQALYKDCLKSAYERRASVYQTYEDHAAQLARHIQNLEEQRVELENQYHQQVKDYNTALEKNQSRLNQAQQRYFEKDNQLANQIMQTQQNNRLESARLQQNKMKDQRRMMGAISSQGAIKRSQANDIISKNDRLGSVIDQGKGADCVQFRSIESHTKSVEKAQQNRESRTTR